MAQIRQLVPGVFVAGQIDADDIVTAASQGVRLIVNNRPDHEEPGQPTSAETEAAVRAAGMDYIYAPARGLPDARVVADVAGALEAGGPVLLHCKSGMRSTAAWAMATAAAGRMSRDDILEAAADAGYDLNGVPF